MRPPSSAHRLNLLLVEPQFVLRRTIVAVAHDLDVANFQEATSVEAATQRLAASAFDGIVIDASSALYELALRLRQGAFASRADTAIIAMSSAMTSTTDEQSEARFLALGHALILRKPFKIAALLQLVERMRPPSAAPCR